MAGEDNSKAGRMLVPDLQDFFRPTITDPLKESNSRVEVFDQLNEGDNCPYCFLGEIKTSAEGLKECSHGCIAEL